MKKIFLSGLIALFPVILNAQIQKIENNPNDTVKFNSVLEIAMAKEDCGQNIIKSLNNLGANYNKCIGTSPSSQIIKKCIREYKNVVVDMNSLIDYYILLDKKQTQEENNSTYNVSVRDSQFNFEKVITLKSINLDIISAQELFLNDQEITQVEFDLLIKKMVTWTQLFKKIMEES